MFFLFTIEWYLYFKLASWNMIQTFFNQSWPFPFERPLARIIDSYWMILFVPVYVRLRSVWLRESRISSFRKERSRESIQTQWPMIRVSIYYLLIDCSSERVLELERKSNHQTPEKILLNIDALRVNSSSPSPIECRMKKWLGTISISCTLEQEPCKSRLNLVPLCPRALGPLCSTIDAYNTALKVQGPYWLAWIDSCLSSVQLLLALFPYSILH